MKSWTLALFVGSACLALTNAWAEEAVWIDVANAQDYSTEHLVDAVHIPYTHIARGVSTRFPDKDTSLKLYDRNQVNAELATEALHVLGYMDVTNKGALAALKKKGVLTTQTGNQLGQADMASPHSTAADKKSVNSPSIMTTRLHPATIEKSLTEVKADYARSYAANESKDKNRED